MKGMPNALPLRSRVHGRSSRFSQAHGREHAPEHGRLERDQVIPRQVGPRVRASARKDHRVRVPPLDVRVILPAAQVIADFVMGGKGDPGRAGRQDSRSGGSGRKTVTCSQSASWSLTPPKVDRQSFIAYRNQYCSATKPRSRVT